MKSSRIIILLGLLAALWAGNLVLSQTPAPQAPAKSPGVDIQALDKLIASELESRGLDGLVFFRPN
jgi:hypothetical protein